MDSKVADSFDSEFMKKEETGDEHLVYHYTQYKFTIAEALEHLCSESFSFYKFGDAMLHNVVLRDAIRGFSVREVVEQIKDLHQTTKNCKDVLISLYRNILMGA